MDGVEELPNRKPDAVVLGRTVDPNTGAEEVFETPNIDVVAVVDGTAPLPNKPVDAVVAPFSNDAVVVDVAPNKPVDGTLLREEPKRLLLVVVVALCEGCDAPKSPDEVVA